jgi:hypothetical protein
MGIAKKQNHNLAAKIRHGTRLAIVICQPEIIAVALNTSDVERIKYGL